MMFRHPTLTAIPMRIAALLLVHSFAAAAPAAAQAQGELVDWSAEAIDRDEAAVALSRFYATMYNSGQIATRAVEVGKGDTPADIMRREGSWPAYLGPANRLLDAVLCDLNPTSCQREKAAASGDVLEDISRNVAATDPTDGDWRGLRPGTTLRIPDYTVERNYETISTTAGYLAKSFGDKARLEPTGALAALYCNQQPSACPDQPALTWKGDSRPTILQFDPLLFDPGSEDVALPKDLIEAYLDPGASSLLVAVPQLSLRQNLALPRSGNTARIGLDEIQQRIPSNVLVVPQLRTESSEVLQEENRAVLERMHFLQPSLDPEEEPSSRIVTIYHFDKQAELQHCVFRNLTGVALYEWREGENGEAAGPVAVTPAGGASGCALVHRTAVESQDHGTHTLGLLVGQLESFAKALPPDVTYFKVVHVPLNASQFESGSAPEATNRIGPVLAALGVSTPNPDVISMSLSWPATGMEKLNQNVLSKEELTTFVVAAPRQEGQNECARGPAGIKWKSGVFAENVISVVGLDLAGSPENPEIVLLDEAGTGSMCHEIGAFGELYGPIGKTEGIGKLAGASQATPLVAAVVAEMIRRQPQDHPKPRQIGIHLVTTAWFNPDMIDRAKATLLDSSGAVRTGADLIVTRSGCRVFGTYVRIKNGANRTDDYFFDIDGDLEFVDSKQDLLSFRNLDRDRVLVVRLVGADVRVQIGQRTPGLNNRTIQLLPEWLDPGGSCEGIDLGRHDFPLSEVDQLIISKLRG